MKTSMVALAGVAALVAACGSDSSSGGGQAAGGSASKPTIGVDYPRADTDFWNSYISYVPKLAGDGGVTSKTTSSSNDVSKLISNTQTLISQGVKGIVMAPHSRRASGDGRVQAAGGCDGLAAHRHLRQDADVHAVSDHAVRQG